MSTFFSFARHGKVGSRIDPVRDWITLLTIALVALAGIVGWNVWVFNTVVEGGVIGGTGTSTPPIVSPATLGAIRTIFRDRAIEETKYETGAYTFSDPSQ